MRRFRLRPSDSSSYHGSSSTRMEKAAISSISAVDGRRIGPTGGADEDDGESSRVGNRMSCGVETHAMVEPETDRAANSYRSREFNRMERRSCGIFVGDGVDVMSRRVDGDRRCVQRLLVDSTGVSLIESSRRASPVGNHQLRPSQHKFTPTACDRNRACECIACGVASGATPTSELARDFDCEPLSRARSLLVSGSNWCNIVYDG
jgi:hypothetical protein